MFTPKGDRLLDQGMGAMESADGLFGNVKV